MIVSNTMSADQKLTQNPTVKKTNKQKKRCFQQIPGKPVVDTVGGLINHIFLNTIFQWGKR